MAKIVKRDDELYEINNNNCWTFNGTQSHNGYGQLSRGGKSWRATHYFLKKKKNIDVPSGLVVDHLCRNRLCVNPDHLEVVTTAENIVRGLLTKISREERDQIFELRKTGLKQVEIGKMFKIGQDEVSRILNNKRLLAYV